MEACIIGKTPIVSIWQIHYCGKCSSKILQLFARQTINIFTNSKSIIIAQITFSTQCIICLFPIEGKSPIDKFFDTTKINTKRFSHLETEKVFDSRVFKVQIFQIMLQIRVWKQALLEGYR